MSSLITYSPFLSSGVVFVGIYYENWGIILLGVVCMIASFFGLLCKCGSDFRDEIERANKEAE